MLKLTWNGAGSCRILCLGAHADDIEIGCGGTVLRLLQQHPNATVRWLVFSSGNPREQEARDSAAAFLARAAATNISVHAFRDGFFPYIGGDIKEVFERLKQEFAPDLIFTTCQRDVHQDHRLISELTWNTFRDHFILEYEIPKYDGDLGSPNVFVELEPGVCETKVRYLLENFATQRDKPWFTSDTFLSILRLRGVECRSSSGYAEAFYCRKLVLA